MHTKYALLMMANKPETALLSLEIFPFWCPTVSFFSECFGLLEDYSYVLTVALVLGCLCYSE